MNKKAFTLIELLVVVLIIGILAAIALPQYRKAVYKTRVAEALTMLRAITDAQEVYYLTNGKYTDDLSELDVQVPNDRIGTWSDAVFEDRYSYACKDTTGCTALVNNASMPYLLFCFLHRADRPELNGKQFCHVIGDAKDNIATSICQSMGVLDTSTTASWFNGKYYRLN